MAIQHIAVIGSGTMGSAIAALAANAGLQVTLLDIAATDGDNRNALAEQALQRMHKQPVAGSPLTHPSNSERIRVGNLEEHMHWVSDADWIVEAIIERLDIKQQLYHKLTAYRKEKAIISSNTSTIPLGDLLRGLPESVASHFMITHFFNPPRFLPLLEVVKSPTMPDSTYTEMCQFNESVLGREVVHAKDTPGFIANRIGVFWLVTGLMEACAQAIAVEEADAVISRPFGVPSTGVFGLFDLIGIDTMRLIIQSLLNALPDDDPLKQIWQEPDWLVQMIEEGYTGRKGKGGFYAIQKEGDKKIKLVRDLQSHAYREAENISLPVKDAAEVLANNSAAAIYARTVWGKTWHYAASLIPDIANDIYSVDQAMHHGYNWKLGPFQLIDKIGVARVVEVLQSLSLDVPPVLQQAETLYAEAEDVQTMRMPDGTFNALPKAENVLRLSDMKRSSKPLLHNDIASLWDMGDGIACLELHTKMNTINHDVLDFIEHSVLETQEDLRGIVVGSDAPYFSAGANLQLFLDQARAGKFDEIDYLLRHGQRIMLALKYAPFPVVAAVSGIALGGGCELCLHADAIQAHSEAQPGLVEAAVGVVPSWGGCKEMLLRDKPIVDVFTMIMQAERAGSAEQARHMGILRESDGITMHRGHLLADAKARCLALADEYIPPEQLPIALSEGLREQLQSRFDAMKVDLPEHTQTIAHYVINILSADGKTQVEEEDILKLERKAFIALIKTEETQARIEHMLKTGKPLKN